ncbi:hypothetical protein [Paenibacillus segetis]|uniref:DUF4168 domain-containing protein n=1 Tax=Paenibacillus segetis TaxID=1325360 RepID=A0ABQ1YSF5_9BACL|nr:hypothetical protein [Paenibacillus segetis]GGH37122.1 hypothetical protein GCM10008013_44390 [Paenibacillus segetis]
MNIKQVIIVGTMAFVVTLSPGLSGYSASAAVALNPPKLTDLSNDAKETEVDPVIEALGFTDEEGIYEELLEGHSLADMAESNHKDVNQIIDLQVSQLREQVTVRYAQGSLTQEQYEQQLDEIPSIVADSVLKRYDLS